MQELLSMISVDVFVFQQDNIIIMYQHIALMTWSSFCAMRHTMMCGQPILLT